MVPQFFLVENPKQKWRIIQGYPHDLGNLHIYIILCMGWSASGIDEEWGISAWSLWFHLGGWAVAIH